MIKRSDGARLTYDMVVAERDALAAELAAERAGAGSRKQLTDLQARIVTLEAIVRDVECLLTIVAPRSHTREYLALLQKAREALGMTPQETATTSCGICDRLVPPGCEGKFRDDKFCVLNTLETPVKHEPTAMGFRCKCGRDWPCTETPVDQGEKK